MPDDEFTSLLGDEADRIARLTPEERVVLYKTPASDASSETRKLNALNFSESETDPLESDTVTMVEPMTLLEFQRPGVQRGVYKKLRLGKYGIDAVLDLHRMTVEQARFALYRFIQDCVDNDVRSALVNHGKGEGRARPALLKSCVAHWLPQMDDVLAYHTAQKQHGSYGATYILLRKSERKKQVNKELHRK